jgi:hypothetical protein
MKAGKRIVRDLNKPIMYQMSYSSDPVVVKAVRVWNNPDQIMDSKVDYTSIVDKGVAKFKNNRLT